MIAIALIDTSPSAVVTTGLVPVVHGMSQHPLDCRDKPGNDDGVWGSWVENRDSRFRGNDTVMLENVQ